MKMRSFLRAVALSGALAAALPAAAVQPSVDDLLASAPVIEVLLDSSGGSPATNSDFLQAAWPQIEQKLRRMPMGSTVIVSSVGDSRAMPMMWRTRIQQKTTIDGAPADAVIRGVKRLVLTFAERVKGKEDRQSHLVAGLYEASRNMNPRSRANVIVMLSDLVEYSDMADCRSGQPCRLPAPTFTLAGVDLQIIGSGARLPPRHAMAVLKAWQAFFAKAGIDLQLNNTM